MSLHGRFAIAALVLLLLGGFCASLDAERAAGFRLVQAAMMISFLAFAVASVAPVVRPRTVRKLASVARHVARVRHPRGGFSPLLC
ncbi:MAG: hypothetical protein AB7O65_09450 [Candidatus Korobacteraceae bacterium]